VMPAPQVRAAKAMSHMIMLTLIWWPVKRCLNLFMAVAEERWSDDFFHAAQLGAAGTGVG